MDQARAASRVCRSASTDRDMPIQVLIARDVNCDKTSTGSLLYIKIIACRHAHVIQAARRSNIKDDPPANYGGYIETTRTETACCTCMPVACHGLRASHDG